MSKIDDMIKKLCPNGVEYKALGEVSKINRGVRVTRDMLAADGKIPVYQNALTPLGFFDKSNRKAYSVFLIGAGAAGKIGFSDIEFWAADDCYTFDDLNQIDDKFLYYFLQTQQNYIDTRVRKGSIPRISRDVFEKIKVPVPPLEVQREIVQVLDSFTTLTAELTAELTARRKQYEYYRDALLSFGKVSPPLTFGLNNEEVRWMTLGEICKNVCSGGTPNTSHSDYYGGDIPWLRTQEVDWKDIQDTEVKITKKGVENSSAKWIPANCVIVAMYGATAAKVAINKIPLTTNQACCNLEVNPQIASYRYVFHWLCNNYQNLKSLGQGSQSNINAGTVKSFKIPVPSLAMQEKIANVLDNFDAICSNLNIGLPAEIELRKKQYEYYRDRILSFNTNVNNSIHGGNLQDEIKLLQYVFGYAMVRLGDIATIMRGGSFQKKDFSESGVPCIHYGQIYTKYGLHADKTFTFISETAAEKQKFAEPNDVVMAVTSENVEDVCKCVAWVGKEKIAVSGHSAIIHHNQNAKYLSYYFHTSMFFEQKRKLAHGTKVIEVTPDTLTKVQIPIPSITEQKRIVEILDKFDALVNDLSQGIPAEIEARKKQYEYYRDKLLSFKTAG